MSVSAFLTDLGSVALARAAQPSKAQTARSEAPKDDTFGEMVREAGKEQPEPPRRAADDVAARARSQRSQPDDRQPADNPPAERPDPPAAALDRRSDKARRSEGPRDRSDEPAARDAATVDGPVDPSQETPRPQSTEAAAEQRKPADSEPKEGAAGVSADPAATQGDAQALAQASAAVTTAAILNQAAAQSIIAPAASPQAAAPQPAVAGDAVAAVGAAAGATAPAAAPAIVPATAADRAAIASAAETLTESAPSAVAPAAEPTTAADGVAAEIARAGGAPSLNPGETPLKNPPAERMAETATATEAVPPSGETKNAPAAQRGGAHNATHEATHAAASRDGASASPDATVAQPTVRPQASAALESLRAAVADAQPQTDGSPAPGPVQQTGLSSGPDLRAPGSPQTVQRHEMPVPLQAVAIEIGMRAMRGAKEFAIRLDPEDLGRIDVKLEVSDAGQVQAKIVVEKVETLQLLQRDARTLERAFDQAGLKTTADGLQFTLRDPGGQGRDNDGRQSRDDRGDGRADEPVIDEIRLQPAQYRIAASGGLDIRI